MFRNFENKTYSQEIQSEISDVEKDSKQIRINMNNNTDIEQDKLFKKKFQPKCIFTKQKNNISFFQSNSKSSYRALKKIKDLSPDFNNKNSTTFKNPPITRFQIYGQEKFSYNNTTTDKNSTNKSKENNNNSNNERLNLNEYLLQKFKRPKREIKSYKNEFNVEKSDNFNVLSYRQVNYESDINKNKNKDKMQKTPVYKKQKFEEIIFPSKRNHSRQLNQIETENNQEIKYKSFFGLFNSSKNSRSSKSTSKIKTNQLNDFNIDKLIEIGDRYASNNPVLPLGKIMNNNILFKNKNNKNNIPISYKSYYNNYFSIKNKEVKGENNFANHTLKNKKIDLEELRENCIDLVKEKKRVTKKLISKNSLKSTKTIDDNKEPEQINNDNIVKKNLNFNIEYDKKDKKSADIKMKKRRIKKMSFNSTTQQNLINTVNYNDQMKTFQEILPIKTKKRTILNLKIDEKENIDNNRLEIASYRNDKRKKHDLVRRKLLTDDQDNYRNNTLQIKVNKKNMLNNTQNREIILNNNKKYKIISNFYYQDNRPKNYYGYDERHILENSINNHVYYESVHSKKKSSNRSFV
jgi:hypothetical protein